MYDIHALSRAPSFTGWLALSDQPIILHIFDEACNLINGRREILSIVHAEIGNGPFNLVLKEPVLFTKHLDVESKISIQETQILLGDLTISLTGARMWNPIPRWDELRKQKDEIVRRLALLQLDNENESILQFSNSPMSLSSREAAALSKTSGHSTTSASSARLRRRTCRSFQASVTKRISPCATSPPTSARQPPPPRRSWQLKSRFKTSRRQSPVSNL